MSTLQRSLVVATVALVAASLTGCLGRNDDKLSQLCERLHSPQSQERIDTAQLIGLQGPLALPAAPELIVLLKSSNPDERATAAQALGRVVIDPVRQWRGTPSADQQDPYADQRRTRQREAVGALTPLIRDEDELVRSAAAMALSYVGCEAESALPELKRLAKSNYAARIAVNDLQYLLANEREKAAKATSDRKP